MAQETTTTKQTVLVDVFAVKSSANATYRSVAKGIRDKVIAAMQKTQRVNVIDVTTESFFDKAAASATSEDALLASDAGAEIRKAASKKFEAKYAVTANIADIKAVRKKTDDGKTYFAGEISMTMKVINLEDGTVAHTKSFTYAGLTAQTGSTDVAAVNNTANYLIAAVPRFIDTAFPVVGRVLDIIAHKKEVATDVYVNIGSAAGVKPKDKFNVYQIKTVAGKEMRTEIGDLTIVEVGGEDISTCKVSKDCGAAIFQSIANPDKVKIVIVSRPKSNVGGALGGFAKGLVN